MRRTGPPLRLVQVLAAILMAACAAGLLIVSVAPSFDARTLQIRGASFTSEAIVRSILGMDGSPNLFRIHTDRAAEQLVRLPAVQSASIQAILPSTIVVNLVERQPKLIWVIGDRRFVVDQNGLLFGLVDTAGNPIPSSVGPLSSPSPYSGASGSPSLTASPTPVATPLATPTPKPTARPTPSPKPTPTPKNPKATPTKAGKATPSPSPSPAPTPTPNPSLIPSLAPAPTADPATTPGPRDVGLPIVFDRRSADTGLGLGGTIDPINLDAGYRIAGLTPADVGSRAPGLAVVLDDAHGFTVSSVPAGWVAEFGFYAPTVRKVTVIPEQVRDLRSLLLQKGEDHVAWVWLVADVSGNGVITVVPR
jgi:cell division septation protein DedD